MAPKDAATEADLARLVTDNWDAGEGYVIRVFEDVVHLDDQAINELMVPRHVFDEAIRWYLESQPLEEKPREVEDLELPEEPG